MHDGLWICNQGLERVIKINSVNKQLYILGEVLILRSTTASNVDYQSKWLQVLLIYRLISQYKLRAIECIWCLKNLDLDQQLISLETIAGLFGILVC